MKKLSKYHLNNISKRLDICFNNATKEHIKDGLAWYSKANTLCKELEKSHGIDTFTIASVISALSPRNKWETNLKDAETVLTAYNNEIPPEDIKVSTFHKNKFKAFEILRGNKRISRDSQKTYAFCQNIAHLNEDFITIDVWHLRACFGKTMGSTGKVAYNQIERLTLKKAKEVGLKGYEYQAILWNSIRENF